MAAGRESNMDIRKIDALTEYSHLKKGQKVTAYFNGAWRPGRFEGMGALGIHTCFVTLEERPSVILCTKSWRIQAQEAGGAGEEEG